MTLSGHQVLFSLPGQKKSGKQSSNRWILYITYSKPLGTSHQKPSRYLSKHFFKAYLIADPKWSLFRHKILETLQRFFALHKCANGLKTLQWLHKLQKLLMWLIYVSWNQSVLVCKVVTGHARHHVKNCHSDTKIPMYSCIDAYM